jgi:hypothetical protein
MIKWQSCKAGAEILGVLPFIGLLFGLWINHPHPLCIPVTSKRKYHWGWDILCVQDAYKDAHSAVIQGFTWLVLKIGFRLLCLIVIELYFNQLHGISKGCQAWTTRLILSRSNDEKCPVSGRNASVDWWWFFNDLLGFSSTWSKSLSWQTSQKLSVGRRSSFECKVVLKRFLQQSSCLDIAAHCIHRLYHWFMQFFLHQYKQHFICHNWGHSLLEDEIMI